MAASTQQVDTPEVVLDEEMLKLQLYFVETDLKLQVGGIDFHVNKAELMRKSETFHKMFTADFKEKHQSVVKLEGKQAKPFGKFLRHVMPEIYNPGGMTKEDAADILPLAHEYQAKDLLERIDDFLAANQSTYAPATEIIKQTILADKFDLQKSLKTCIMITIRRSYGEIFQNPLFKNVAMMQKRWKHSNYKSATKTGGASSDEDSHM